MENPLLMYIIAFRIYYSLGKYARSLFKFWLKLFLNSYLENSDIPSYDGKIIKLRLFRVKFAKVA